MASPIVETMSELRCEAASLRDINSDGRREYRRDVYVDAFHCLDAPRRSRPRALGTSLETRIQ
jgi:hypothetical protein